jgi:hypothetical protein
MNGTMRKIQIAVAAVAVVVALALSLGGGFGIQRAGAQQISTTTDGWTRENFASSCKAAGGRVVEIDSPGIKYSKCYFPDGSVNKCDWIKKICTFGLVAGTGTRFDLAVTTAGTLQLEPSNPTPTTTSHGSSTRATSGAVLQRKED